MPSRPQRKEPHDFTPSQCKLRRIWESLAPAVPECPPLATGPRALCCAVTSQGSICTGTAAAHWAPCTAGTAQHFHKSLGRAVLQVQPKWTLCCPSSESQLELNDNRYTLCSSTVTLLNHFLLHFRKRKEKRIIL